MPMRLMAGLVAILPALVIITAVIASAEMPRKHSTIEALGVKRLFGWPPNGADVLRTLHQFNLFQLRAATAAELRGSDLVRQYAAEQAELARQRELQISRLNAFTTLGIDFPDRPNPLKSSRLAGLHEAMGLEFAAEFNDKQRAEFQRMLALVRRYLLHPDDDLIRRFAIEQLRQLQDGLANLDSLPAS